MYYDLKQGYSKFTGGAEFNPKFTGDVLYHVKLAEVIKACHVAAIEGISDQYYKALYSLYVEVRFYLKDGEEKSKAEKVAEFDRRFDTLYGSIFEGMVSGRKQDGVFHFSYQKQLNDLFRDVYTEVCISGIILRPEKPKRPKFADAFDFDFANEGQQSDKEEKEDEKTED